MQEEQANLIFTDPPYNVKIQDNVAISKAKTRKQFQEFSYASGEMNPQEFTQFLKTSLQHLYNYSSRKNLCVWNKGYGGMGSLYRSQHELIFVYQKGTGQYTNNIELGKHGRNRTNIWDYPGMRPGKDGWGLHPTVKPTRLIMDAIRDCSRPKDIILDPFGGSGSTLLACEKTQRQARLIELDPHYADITLERYHQLTNKEPKLISRTQHHE